MKSCFEFLHVMVHSKRCWSCRAGWGYLPHRPESWIVLHGTAAVLKCIGVSTVLPLLLPAFVLLLLLLHVLLLLLLLLLPFLLLLLLLLSHLCQARPLAGQVRVLLATLSLQHFRRQWMMKWTSSTSA